MQKTPENIHFCPDFKGKNRFGCHKKENIFINLLLLVSDTRHTEKKNRRKS
eukprot:UN16941